MKTENKMHWYITCNKNSTKENKQRGNSQKCQ